MKISKLKDHMFGICIALVALAATTPAHAYSVYRSVTVAAGTNVVAWTAANFGVSGNPPTLSFFYFASDADALNGLPQAQCFVKVALPGVAENPQEGDDSSVGNAEIHFDAAAADQPKPFPWKIVFDNDPPGHWSIAKEQITDAATNAAASRVSAAAFKALATTAGSGVTVIDGTLQNCAAQ